MLVTEGMLNMGWNTFWAIHRRAYWLTMWIVSIKCAILGVFCLFVGFQRPLLFIFALPCLALCVIVNPWAVRRYEQSRQQ